MNVIEASYILGRAIYSQLQEDTIEIINKDYLKPIIGEELSIRLMELFDYQCSLYGFFGYDASLALLNEMKNEADTLESNYWKPLAEEVDKHDSLISLITAYRDQGIYARSLIAQAHEREGVLEGVRVPIDIIDPFNNLSATIKRTGVIRAFVNAASLLQESDISEAQEYNDKRGCQINSSFSAYLKKDFKTSKNLSSIEDAIDSNLLIWSIVEKALFWGFINHRPVISREQFEILSLDEKPIGAITLATNSLVAVTNRMFAAVRIVDDESTQFYLLPARVEHQFKEEGYSACISGITYPANDWRLFG